MNITYWTERNYLGVKVASSLLKNYHGITILSNLSKVLEKLLLLKIHQQDSPPVWNPLQGSFREQVGCIHTEFILQEAIQSLREKGEKAYVAYLDVRKALDTVWHQGLLVKLHQKGIRGPIWQIINKWYTSSNSSIIWDNQQSRPFPCPARGCSLPFLVLPLCGWAAGHPDPVWPWRVSWWCLLWLSNVCWQLCFGCQLSRRTTGMGEGIQTNLEPMEFRAKKELWAYTQPRLTWLTKYNNRGFVCIQLILPFISIGSHYIYSIDILSAVSNLVHPYPPLQCRDLDPGSVGEGLNSYLIYKLPLTISICLESTSS